MEALKENFRNGVKETREKVVCDKERNTGIRDNVSCINTTMYCNEKIREFGMLKPNFSEIYKDLLFFKQINSSRMFSAPPVLNTDTWNVFSTSCT